MCGAGISERKKKKVYYRASLVVQWLRICLAMQGTLVQSLVQEDPICHGASSPGTAITEPLLLNKRNPCTKLESSSCLVQLEKDHMQQ